MRLPWKQGRNGTTIVDEPQFLYLTTIGRRTNQPRTIEIWFVSYNGNYYLVAENRERAHWVQNILHNPIITLRIGDRTAPELSGVGRSIDPAHEPELANEVARRMDVKYNWSDGLIVELKPH